MIDLLFGEPPSLLHPVVWMGKLISLWERLLQNGPRTVQFICGICITVFLVALFALPVYYLLIWLKTVYVVLYIFIAALVLKITFSIRELRLTALKIKDLLVKDKLEQMRFEMRALVSRNTANMPGVMLASAAVESVAESICDSIVAPLFYFMIMGIPGALGYRVINTLDAMIGYHGRYEYLGKFAAYVDDILNYIPARLSALMIVAAAAILRKNMARAWITAVQEHRRTASPNAGWTMAAVAGALNVRLEKQGDYIFCDSGNAPGAGTISSSLHLVITASLLWVLLCLFAGTGYIFVTAGA